MNKLRISLAAIVAITAFFILTQVEDQPRQRVSHKSVSEYWTEERRDSAIPHDLQRKGGGGGGGTTGSTWTSGGDASKTTGKVFFTQGGVNYVCSGSAVQSAHENLVLTAGHCAHEGSGGGFSTNFIFYPGYNYGPNAALGSWTATRLYTTPAWSSGSNFDEDAGMAVVVGAGGTLEDRLTGQGAQVPTIDFDSPSTVDTYTSFGYPAAQKYKGNTLIYCQGKVQVYFDGNQTMALRCNMTGGSSGGPWLVEYSSGDRVIESLNSYSYSSIRNTMFGPIFGAAEQSMFNAASTGVGGIHN